MMTNLYEQQPLAEGSLDDQLQKLKIEQNVKALNILRICGESHSKKVKSPKKIKFWRSDRVHKIICMEMSSSPSTK